MAQDVYGAAVALEMDARTPPDGRRVVRDARQAQHVTRDRVTRLEAQLRLAVEARDAHEVERLRAEVDAARERWRAAVEHTSDMLEEWS
jgi:hypothetical protein